jgi:apolipoprotein N-acyltransferase
MRLTGESLRARSLLNSVAMFKALARVVAPTRFEWLASILSALLLLLAFPNFDFAVLAWIALVPLFIVIARRPSPGTALLLGWVTGSLFYYASCYWLTYSMIHYGELPPVVAYLLLAPATIVTGLFTGLATAIVAIAVKRFGSWALLTGAIFWVAFDWLRLEVTGQLWNAIGYSQAFTWSGLLVQPAQWGGVYAVSFLLVLVNAAIALALLKRKLPELTLVAAVIGVVVLLIYSSGKFGAEEHQIEPDLYVVALQPNVPMTIIKSVPELKELRERHFAASIAALNVLPQDNVRRLVVWPESPMNFGYSTEQELKDQIAKFTRENHASLILNSLEPAPNDGAYNSALLINEEGRLIAQYDKIRLMPFGEYVPLPQWLPGASLITGLVGEFTAGSKYTVMPVGTHRAGVFICIESAYPWIARRLSQEGADVLINISNDGYLGPTAVMRQHLANNIFRAVENRRTLLRVTNTGLSALISADGKVQDQTRGYEIDVRVWKIGPTAAGQTFYTRHGDIFVHLCAVLGIVILVATFYRRRGVAVT